MSDFRSCLTPERQRKAQLVLNERPLSSKDASQTLRVLAGIKLMNCDVEGSRKLIAHADEIDDTSCKRSKAAQSLYELGHGLHSIGRHEKAADAMEKVLALDKEPKHRLDDLVILAESCSALPHRHAQGHGYALEAHRLSCELFGHYHSTTLTLLERFPFLQEKSFHVDKFRERRVRRGSAVPRVLQTKPWK